MPSRRPNNKRDVSNRIFFRNEQGQKNVKNHRNRDLVSQMTITQVIRDESSDYINQKFKAGQLSQFHHR